MAVEVSGVTLCPGDDLITAAHLDYPQAGPVDRYAFEVIGWVASKVPAAEVEFHHEGIVVERCGLNRPRPDVARKFADSSTKGFWRAIGTVGLAPAFTLEVWVLFEDGRRCQLAEIRGTQRLTSAFTPSMQPIMVTSAGRSGSTWLMRMLAQHPDVVVHEQFPYETFACSYWMHFIQVLAAPGDNSQVESLHFWRDTRRIAPFPYFFVDSSHMSKPTGAQATLDRWYSGQVEEFARVAQATVESFYRACARENKRTTPAFFAEKVAPAGHYWTMQQLYPRARQIFLVRDPRDYLASVLAFNARVRERVGGAALTGFDGFGREAVETDEEYVEVIRTSMLSFVELWKRRSQYSALVRYEDLIRSPAEQVRAMLDSLELDSSGDIVDAMVKAGNEATADVNAHRTSPDVSSSIGRWKRDLEPRLQKICDEAFDGILDEFSGSTPAQSVAAAPVAAEPSVASTSREINMEPAGILDAHFSLITAYQNLFAAYRERGVSRSLNPNDKELIDRSDESIGRYYSVGADAMRVVINALLTNSRQPPQSILDFPSGSGRVTRHLCAFFPEARIVASDLYDDHLDFCREAFQIDCVPSLVNLSEVDFGEEFDLIFCGSLLSHLPETSFLDTINLLGRSLSDSGIAVVTLQGRFSDHVQATMPNFYLPDQNYEVAAEGVRRTGFGYVDYTHDVLSGIFNKEEGYGIALVRPHWVVRLLEPRTDLRLLGYVERGWDNHQDVLIFGRPGVNA
ncbi:sulfotransferase [Mycobacterium conspicuum]|jgi:SAM-dependent methyltransferase|uniref:Uncharacterized protein n=1 Tax=Mycobacterium conspicuum TaxID=44010 RepID=A0A1X1T3A5_9MYCO|nr:sulfotransferase [Mycobacterium conspicuum]ORV38803.1 hypothetical protein AWC00_19230 [Mycobacterium conspicuum]BBZ40924.1 hypothetical protein MCNS_39870 [Mycobacterium conspicuum]